MLTVSAADLLSPANSRAAASAAPAAARRFDGARAADPVSALLTDAERQPCEVWTRVMGYHRPVASFNAGKQSEHAERRFFRAGE
jgi:hypothetical protein